MLTYTSLCNAGAREIMTQSQYERYLNETIISTNDPQRNTLIEWMKGFDMLDYFNNHIHIPR
jgi:hypothetical protein